MISEYEVNFGRNIRKLRKKQKVTQKQLAIRLQLQGYDITRSAIAKIEVAQRHVYPDEILAIKKALNLSFEDLFIENE